MPKETNISLPLFKELLDAHLNPIRSDISEIKDNVKQVKATADAAQQDIQSTKDMGKGLIIGYGVVGGGLGTGLLTLLIKLFH